MGKVLKLRCQVRGQGLHEITHHVEETLADALEATGLRDGLCTLYLRHTSASLLIQENADPAVCRDLEAWLGEEPYVIGEVWQDIKIMPCKVGPSFVR